MRRHPIRLRGNAKGNMRGEPPSTGTERGSVGLVSDRRFGFSTPFAILAVVLGLSAFAGISFAGDVNLAWNASTGAAGYKVHFGTASGAYGTSVDVGTRTTYTVTGLAAGTYYFAVTAYDSSGVQSGFSNEATAAVTGGDTTPPVISAVSSSSVTFSSATVTWTTNEQTNSQVDYGATASYGSSTPLNATLVTAHSQGLSGLAASATYHFRVKSVDAAGNPATSGDFTFTTSATADTTAPVISSVSSSGVSGNAATIRWSTNEAANSQVQYGTSTSYGSTSALDPSLTTSHTQTLSGLAAGTIYHYRVTSKDAATNLVTSSDFTFKTTTPLNADLVVAYSFDEGAGTTAADYSGNSNTGTLFNASWTTGKYGNALWFNGKNAYVTAPCSGLPAMNAPQTIAYWFTASRRSTSTEPVVSLADDAQQISIQAGFKDSRIGVWQDPGSWLVAANQPSRTWHYIVYTFDGATHRFYVDGDEKGSSTIRPTAAAPTSLQIGRVLDGSDYLRGTVDELRVYSRALSQTEIQSLMNIAIGSQP